MNQVVALESTNSYDVADTNKGAPEIMDTPCIEEEETSDIKEPEDQAIEIGVDKTEDEHIGHVETNELHKDNLEPEKKVYVGVDEILEDKDKILLPNKNNLPQLNIIHTSTSRWALFTELVMLLVL